MSEVRENGLKKNSVEKGENEREKGKEREREMKNYMQKGTVRRTLLSSSSK